MGGYLQSLIFGYGGLRIYEDKLAINGALPMTATSMKIIGIDYLGGSLDIYFLHSSVEIILTKQAMVPLQVVMESTRRSQTLSIGVPIIVRRSKVFITPV